MVTRFNPCGALCEFMRRPYSTTARMFRNSDEEVDFVWYPALPSAPPLPFPSIFLDPVWQDDYYSLDDGPGLILEDNIRANWQKPKPLATGTHHCGTEQDFLEGGIYDPDLPPVPYRDNWLPLCCPGEERAGSGGAAMGGHVDYVYVPPVPPWTPGNTCATAAVADLDTVYTFQSASGGAQWINVPDAVGLAAYWLLVQVDNPDFVFQVNLWVGTSCSNITFQSGMQTNVIFDFVVPSGKHAWLALNPFGPIKTVHFQVATTYPTWTIYPYGGIAAGGKVTPTYTP